MNCIEIFKLRWKPFEWNENNVVKPFMLVETDRRLTCNVLQMVPLRIRPHASPQRESRFLFPFPFLSLHFFSSQFFSLFSPEFYSTFFPFIGFVVHHGLRSSSFFRSTTIYLRRMQKNAPNRTGTIFARISRFLQNMDIPSQGLSIILLFLFTRQPLNYSEVYKFAPKLILCSGIMFSGQ